LRCTSAQIKRELLMSERMPRPLGDVPFEGGTGTDQRECAVPFGRDGTAVQPPMLTAKTLVGSIVTITLESLGASWSRRSAPPYFAPTLRANW
jgi:hypothetical protein